MSFVSMYVFDPCSNTCLLQGIELREMVPADVNQLSTTELNGLLYWIEKLEPFSSLPPEDRVRISSSSTLGHRSHHCYGDYMKPYEDEPHPMRGQILRILD